MENRGEEGNSPQEIQELQAQPQTETTRTIQVDVHPTTGRTANITPRLEENNGQVRSQGTETLQENVHEQIEQTSQNQTDESSRGAFENNTENSGDVNLNINQHTTTSNNTNPSHVLEYRSRNSQNYSQVGALQNIKTPQQVILPQN